MPIIITGCRIKLQVGDVVSFKRPATPRERLRFWFRRPWARPPKKIVDIIRTRRG